MPLVDDIAAVRANGNLTDREKDLAVYSIKTTALIDVILNGKPAPNPIPPLLNRTFTLNGVSYLTRAARDIGDGTLELIVTFTRAPAQPVTHTIRIVNPPVLPRSLTGNEKQDLIQAASEMLEGFV
jgi:hypothetical protein